MVVLRSKMTQAKLKSADIDEEKKKTKQNMKSIYFNDKCMQIAAWILLTLGVCIIISTFFLAVLNNDDYFNVSGGGGDGGGGGGGDNTSIIGEYPQLGRDINLVSRILDDKIKNFEILTTNGCEVNSCKMICMSAKNLNADLFDSMRQNSCTSMESLVIKDQEFRNGGILENNWLVGEQHTTTIREVSIINSNVQKIENAAFNAPMFSATFILHWKNLNVSQVESGALLGLIALKYLLIDTKLNCLDRAFFQPVQTTLVYLKLHAGIAISSDENIFGISKMKKLEYVDLSRNKFNGFITKATFESLPNLKYLKMSENQISAISADAFDSVHVKKLILLDLSNNMLKTIDPNALKGIFMANSRTIVNLAMNPLACDCKLRPFAMVYKQYRSQFMNGLYCKAPHSFYGKFIDEIDFESLNCTAAMATSSSSTLIRSRETENGRTTESNYVLSRENIDGGGGGADGPQYENDEIDDIEDHQSIHLRCWSNFDTKSRHRADSEETSNSKSIERLRIEGDVSSMEPSPSFEYDNENDLSVSYSMLRDIPAGAAVGKIDYFEFPRPEYEMDLLLLENNTVKVTIFDYKSTSREIHIIWFDGEDTAMKQSDTLCLRYDNPFVITDPLETNKTYTFCFVPDSNEPISPFNCLPLHVPDATNIHEDIWITHEQKSLTIGMLCLIFFISTFTGAVIAYFGIKAYPDLLEGSKNVLIVKKSDQTCYVSTISEADYIKKSSLKTNSSSSSIHKKPCLSNKSKSLSQTSFATSDLSRISSVKSSSTCFEDAFPPSSYMNDEYEMPKPVDKSEHTYESRCIPNTYVASRPCQSPPPPLPKRNSRSFSENPY